MLIFSFNNLRGFPLFFQGSAAVAIHSCNPLVGLDSADEHSTDVPLFNEQNFERFHPKVDFIFQSPRSHFSLYFHRSEPFIYLHGIVYAPLFIDSSAAWSHHARLHLATHQNSRNVSQF